MFLVCIQFIGQNFYGWIDNGINYLYNYKQYVNISGVQVVDIGIEIGEEQLYGDNYNVYCYIFCVEVDFFYDRKFYVDIFLCLVV